MPTFNNRTRAATLGGIAALVIAAAAIAYWTGGGSGSGSGTVATTGAGVVLTGTVAAGSAPGVPVPVTFTAANAGASAVQVMTVHLVSVTADGSHSGCATGDFTMADVSQAAGIGHAVPAGAVAEALPTPGSLVFANTATSQDACKGATLTLALSST